VSAVVLTRLAAVHQTLASTSANAVLAWDYEADLHASAEATLEAFESVTSHESLAALRPARGALQRTIAALGTIRQTLLLAEPFGRTVLHGDLHSGNVIVHGGNAVLLDWGRSRVGSALEDVSSWLQSLGYWEPEAKRRHDTLFRHYLAARGLSSVLRRSVREAYWLAAASNVLAGALRYHLLLADGRGLAPSRSRADWRRARLQAVRQAGVWPEPVTVLVRAH
jgi:aminoglycoside phosphotransferase (APT) family kinase protein